MILLLLQEDAGRRAEWIAKQYPALKAADVQAVVDLDPSPTKRYAQWTAKQLAAGNIRLPEDAPEIRRSLEAFDKLRGRLRGPQADIMRLKHPADLHELVASGLLAGLGGRLRKDEGARLLVSEDPYEFWEISSPQTAERCLQDAAWCAKHQAAAKIYMRTPFASASVVSPLILILKHDKPLALLSVSRGEFKDVHNRPFFGPELEDLKRLAPKAGITRFTREVERIGPRRKSRHKRMPWELTKDAVENRYGDDGYVIHWLPDAERSGMQQADLASKVEEEGLRAGWYEPLSPHFALNDPQAKEGGWRWKGYVRAGDVGLVFRDSDIQRKDHAPRIIPGSKPVMRITVHEPGPTNLVLHRNLVLSALEQGKKVPGEVLADYPDLR